MPGSVKPDRVLLRVPLVAQREAHCAWAPAGEAQHVSEQFPVRREARVAALGHLIQPAVWADVKDGDGFD